MKRDFIDNERLVVLGVPEIECMRPVIDRGYRTGLEMTVGGLCVWLDEVPEYYNTFRLDGVPRGTQAQRNILESTIIVTAIGRDEDAVDELRELSKEFGLGWLRLMKLSLDVKKQTKANRAA